MAASSPDYQGTGKTDLKNDDVWIKSARQRSSFGFAGAGNSVSYSVSIASPTMAFTLMSCIGSQRTECVLLRIQHYRYGRHQLRAGANAACNAYDPAATELASSCRPVRQSCRWAARKLYQGVFTNSLTALDHAASKGGALKLATTP